MATLKDKLWLWGHPEGKYYNEYGNTELSRMTPLEGAMYLDCTGLFMVPVGVQINRRQYNHSFKPMARVGWDLLRNNDGVSLHGAGANPDFAKELVEEAREFKNITCGVFDDFIAGGRYKKFPLENIYKTADILHNNDVRRLDMWMVLYTDEFGVDAEKMRNFGRMPSRLTELYFGLWANQTFGNLKKNIKFLKKKHKAKSVCSAYIYITLAIVKKQTLKKLVGNLIDTMNFLKTRK